MLQVPGLRGPSGAVPASFETEPVHVARVDYRHELFIHCGISMARIWGIAARICATMLASFRDGSMKLVGNEGI